MIKTFAEKYLKIMTKKPTLKDKLLIAQRALEIYGSLDFWAYSPHTHFYTDFIVNPDDAWKIAQKELARIQ